ncbi:Predicted ferric reductase [Friedmanniella luteola]|uniref:Predicted ferric reductase n=1 Tax=Friedmanniella luteola TaxID=546871 RepID=A0A1H1LAP8_9ACTN|nr:ferredoxin reductase family protein [Friedmanniella luteola]SDR71105.1 Predicted ferric reductase [Friedmanniella luteola]
MTAVLAAPPAVPMHTRDTRLDAEARGDSAVRLVFSVALWAGLLLVTYWWDRDGGVTDLTGWESGLTSVGRLTGLWSSDLLLVQVLLMSRLPPLENAFGRDRLARIHRVIGFLSFDLMIAHIVLIIGGYASGRWTAVPGTTWDLLTNYGGVLLSAAGTVCLVVVVVTSIKAARRKLRYESWHLIHLYAYLGVGLALPHQLWTGQEFLSSLGRTAYWWTLWGAAAGAVLVWRLGLPLMRSLRFELRVARVVRESSDVVSVHLTGRRLDRLPVRAGQFLTVRFLTSPGWTRGNPFSLSAAPDGRSLRITAKALGEGSARLAHLQPGTRVLFEGPYGRLSSRTRTQRKVLLAGAGVGITPLRGLAEGLDYAPGEAVLLHRYTGQPLFAPELSALAHERGLQVLALPGPRAAPGSVLGPTAGRDELRALQSWIPDLAERDVFLCGPTAWTEGVERLVLAAGVPADRIHTESFGW